MPRSSHLPTYCLHKPSGRAYVRIRGKVVYCGVYGSAESKAEYARLIAEAAASPGATATPTTAAVTVVEVIDAYWLHASVYYAKDGKPTRHVDRVRLALRSVKELYGSTPAEAFGPLALRAIQNRLVESGVSRRYINDQIGEVRRMFKWAASVEMIPATVFHALATVPGLKRGRTAARETAPVMPVADELVDATLPYMPQVVADMARIQRLTAARPGEVCQMRPRDVDRSGDVWEYRPASHKTQHLGRSRGIYIGPKAQAVLRPYLGRDPESFCFSPAESEQQRRDAQRAARKTKVQPSQRNRRRAKPKRSPAACYTKDSYQRAIARAVIKANRERTEAAADMGVKPILLPHWHANQLRHLAATKVRREHGLEAAQVLLGHAKADVTQVYAERDATLAAEVARRIG